MQRFTDERGPDTPDELWSLQHPPVFTLGMNADSGHVLAPGDIPVIPIDRGGQVTYHGPGQLVVDVLVDLGRRSLVVRELVMAHANASRVGQHARDHGGLRSLREDGFDRVRAGVTTFAEVLRVTR